jgi:hypothetical protein
MFAHEYMCIFPYLSLKWQSRRLPRDGFKWVDYPSFSSSLSQFSPCPIDITTTTDNMYFVLFEFCFVSLIFPGNSFPIYVSRNAEIEPSQQDSLKPTNYFDDSQPK